MVSYTESLVKKIHPNSEYNFFFKPWASWLEMHIVTNQLLDQSFQLTSGCWLAWKTSRFYTPTTAPFRRRDVTLEAPSLDVFIQDFFYFRPEESLPSVGVIMGGGEKLSREFLSLKQGTQQEAQLSAAVRAVSTRAGTVMGMYSNLPQVR